MPKIGYSRRALALGRDGLVASCHPLATLAGVETLKAGGTAADAAVATNAVLAVTQSNNCGVGGDLFCLYWEAATRRVHFLNGAGRAGGRASLDELRRRGLKGLPVIGAETVSVPGVTRAWAMLLERFGRRTLDGLLQPAIHYAADAGRDGAAGAQHAGGRGARQAPVALGRAPAPAAGGGEAGLRRPRPLDRRPPARAAAAERDARQGVRGAAAGPVRPRAGHD